MKYKSFFVLLLFIPVSQLNAQVKTSPCDLKISLGADQVICKGDSAILSVDGSYQKYLWSDGSTLDKLPIMRNDTVSLLVTDSNGCEARDTVVVKVATSLLRGELHDAAHDALGGALVYLLILHKEDSLVTVEDSCITDEKGVFSFAGKSGKYYLRAGRVKDKQDTYYGDSPIIQTAVAVDISLCDTVSVSIVMGKLKSKSGSHRLGGKLLKHGKTIQGIRLILYNADQQAVAFSISNDKGEFIFKDIEEGSYSIWVDHPYIDNTGSVSIDIYAGLTEKDELTLIMHSKFVEILNYAAKSIEAAQKDPGHVYRLVLNSLKYDDKGKSLIMDGDKIMPKPGIAQLSNLEQLELSYNQLTELPAEMGKLLHLRSLILTGNKLKKLPKECGELKKLKVLNLKDNILNEFPEAVLHMTSLEELVLKINEIPMIPAGLGQLKNLKVLDLGSNFELESLPDEITGLPKLEKLYLESCSSLKSLPEGIENMKQLKYIDLSYTKIPQKKVENLRKALSGCKIKFNKK